MTIDNATEDSNATEEEDLLNNAMSETPPVANNGDTDSDCTTINDDTATNVSDVEPSTLDTDDARSMTFEIDPALAEEPENCNQVCNQPAPAEFRYDPAPIGKSFTYYSNCRK